MRRCRLAECEERRCRLALTHAPFEPKGCFSILRFCGREKRRVRVEFASSFNARGKFVWCLERMKIVVSAVVSCLSDGLRLKKQRRGVAWGTWFSGLSACAN